MSEISLSTGPPARSSGVLIDAEKIPESDLERRAVRTRGGEQRRRGGTNRFDTGQPEPRDPSGFVPLRKPSPASSASCEIGPPRLPLSRLSLSSGTRLKRHL